MSWRLATALVNLRNEVNARWPKRDKASDGTIGDAAHASRTSDHNPWVKDRNGVGVVRAVDIDKDGINAAWLAEHVRQLGANGDPRLRNGGYVIFNRRITNPDFRAWRAYTGSNPHTKHVHISFSTDHYDNGGGWGISKAPSGGGTGGGSGGGSSSGKPTLKVGSRGPNVRALQTFLNRVYPAYSKLATDGIYGSKTAAVVREFQRRSGLASDGIVGPRTWAALRM